MMSEGVSCVSVRDTYDIRVPACATDSVPADVFPEPIVLSIPVDCGRSNTIRDSEYKN